MALAMRQDDLFAPYRSGAFATARRRVRQAAFGYCATPDREAYERMILPMMTGLADAPRALPGPAEGCAAAEALIDGIVLRKLLFDASEPGRCSGHHLETFRHGIWGLDGVGSCAGRLDPGHGHGWLVASISKMLAAYHRWNEWGSSGTDLSGMTGLETFAARLVEAGDITAARSAAKMIVQLRRRQVHSYGSRYDTALATSLHRLAAACEQAGDIHDASTYRAEATALTRVRGSRRPGW
jgi:hypothetical protein